MSRIEINKKIVLINSASSVISMILNFSVLIWLQQYLLKRISPEEYSLVPVLLSIIAFAPLLTIVLTQGIGRYISVAYARGDTEEVSRICSTMFPLLLIAGTVLITIGWAGAWNINNFLEIAPEYVSDAKLMMALLVFSTTVRLVLSLFGAGFIVKQKLMLQDMIDVGTQLLRIAVLFLLLFGESTRVLWVIVALVVGELSNALISTIVSLRLVPEQRIKINNFHWRIAMEITGYGGWGFLGKISETIKQAIDPIILNKFATAVDVSVFYVAGIAPRQLRLVLAPLTRPFIPVITSMYATGDMVKLGNTYLRTARYHSWVLLIISVPGIIFSYETMHIYLGGKYDDAGNVMSILLFVTVLNAFNALGPFIAEVCGKIKEISLLYITAQVGNLVFTILLVVYLQKGAMGAALATLIALVLFEITMIWPFCRKISNVSIKQWYKEVVYPCLMTALPSIFLCLMFKTTIDVSSWAELFLVCFLSAGLHLCMIMFYGLRQQDKIDIGRAAEHLPGPIKPLAIYFSRQ